MNNNIKIITSYPKLKQSSTNEVCLLKYFPAVDLVEKSFYLAP